jgi:hypothetical protein
MEFLKSCADSSDRIVSRCVEKNTLIWIVIFLFIGICVGSGVLIAKTVSFQKDVEFYTYKYDCRLRETQILEFPEGNNATSQVKVVTCHRGKNQDVGDWIVGGPTQITPAENAVVIIGWILIVWGVIIIVYGRS